VKKHVCYFT